MRLLRFLNAFLYDRRGSSYLHHGDSRVDLGRQRDVDLVLVSVNTTCRRESQRRSLPNVTLDWGKFWRGYNTSVLPDSHALLNVSGGNLITQVHHKFGKLFDIDDVFGVFRVSVDDLCASVGMMIENKACWNSRLCWKTQVNWVRVCFLFGEIAKLVKWWYKHDIRTHFQLRFMPNGLYLATCRGCSLCRVCLSAARSHSAGGARPVSDSLMPWNTNAQPASSQYNSDKTRTTH